MELFYRKIGSGSPVIILHGLYGSGDNWYTTGRELSATNTIYLIDQRNHGNSPHNPDHNYDILGNDIEEFMEQNSLEKAIVIGHSMGGKAALSFGLKYPGRIEKMMVVDISPLGYTKSDEDAEHKLQKQIVAALKGLDLVKITTREEADRQLSRSLSSAVIRQFLLKSLKRTNEGKFTWAFNLKALEANLDAIFDGVIHEDTTDPRAIPEFPLVFMRGERSPYFRPHDEEAIRHYFPHAEIITIPGAGHWIHAEQPEAFLKIVKGFID